MTILVMDELRDYALVQHFTIFDELRTHLKAVRLNLYIHNNPPGDLTLTVRKNNIEVGSRTISISDMISSGEISNNFAHGYFLFHFDSTLMLEKGLHTLELTGENGYNFNESAYIGWIKGHDPQKINTQLDVPENPFENAFDYQLWKFKR